MDNSLLTHIDLKNLADKVVVYARFFNVVSERVESIPVGALMLTDNRMLIWSICDWREDLELFDAKIVRFDEDRLYESVKEELNNYCLWVAENFGNPVEQIIPDYVVSKLVTHRVGV